jgi:hypothetical protein
MALISGSKLVYILAGVRNMTYLWFLRYVEQCVISHFRPSNLRG